MAFDILGHTYVSLSRRRLELEKGAKIMVAEEEEVTSGQVLARGSGLFRPRLFRAPLSGTVHLEGDRSAIEVIGSPERFNLVSGIEAKVVKVVPKLSVLLQTAATIIQGVWGQGGEVVGEIRFRESKDPKAEAFLTTKDLGPEDVGKILIFPGFVPTSTLQKAKALGAVAVVCAGVEAALPEMSLPILVTEGFGLSLMTSRLIESFRAAVLKTAVVSVARRQVIMPNYQEAGLASAANFSESREVKVGDQIQILTWPYFSEEAITLRSLGAIRFESGIKAESWLVKRSKNGEEVKIPADNLLILE